MIKNHGVVVLIRNGEKFLFLKDSRALMLDCWAPPHGRCDESDKDEQAAVKREVLEETGLSVNPQKRFGRLKLTLKLKQSLFGSLKLLVAP